MSRAQELVAIFDVYEGRYLREEVEEALTLREEITPLLIAVLEAIAADPARYIAEGHYAEAYAVTLLAHFRETAAHLPIIRAFTIDSELCDYIWAEMLTETLPALLCRTAGGDYSRIMDIVRGRDANVYLRSTAMEALKLGIASGDLPREQGIALYATLFDETLAEPGDYFWASLVMDLLDIYPGELIAEVRDLFAKGFVYEGEVGLGEVEEVMSAGFPAAKAKLEEVRNWRLPDDVHGYISWFAGFQENGQAASNRPVSPAKARTVRKEKSRTKRKKAKASKRKNRK